MHAIEYMWLNVRSRSLWQQLLAQALHMAARDFAILNLAEAQSRPRPEDPPFLDYIRHIVLPAAGKMGAGLHVYVRSGTTTRATMLWRKEDANPLLMEVLTLWGKHHVLAAHAPHINIGCEPYVRRWAEIWREVTRMVDVISVMEVADTNSAARLADRGTLRPYNTAYWTFLRAFNPGTWWTCTRSHLRHTPVSKWPRAPASTRSPATVRRRSRWLPTTIGVALSCLTTMSASSSPSPTRWPG